MISKQSIIIFLIINLVSVTTHALGINLQGAPITMQANTILEVDRLVGDSLQVSLGIGLTINPDKINSLRNFTVIVSPFETSLHKSAKDITVEVCEGGIGGASFEEVMIGCEKRVNATIIPVSSNDPVNAREIIMHLDESETWKMYVIRVNYTLPNFLVTQGTNYVAWFTTRCNLGSDSCNGWMRTVMLPTEDSVIERLPEKAEIDRYKGKWVIRTNSPDNQQIWFSKYSETDTWIPLRWALVGAVFGALLSIIIEKIMRH